MPNTRTKRVAEAILINARKICLLALFKCTATRCALVALRGPEDRDMCYKTFLEPENFFIFVTLCHIASVYDATCLADNPGNIIIVMVCDDDYTVCGLQ